MNTLQCNKCLPICCECDCAYKGITNDMCNFYLSCPKECTVDVFDFCLNKKKCIPVCHPYTSICYDSSNNCFWAIAEKEANHIYKLDCNMREIDCITVKVTDCCYIILTGVSNYDCDNLIICGNFGMAIISKCECCCGCDTVIDKCCCEKQYLSVVSTPCGIVSGVNKCQTNYITLREKCEDIVTCCLPECYKIEDMSGCMNKCSCRVFVLVTKHCHYSYILVCDICNVCENVCCCEPLCTPICCDNYCPPKPNCSQSAGAIIESIALSETALAHILNAEGEKLQKIIGQSDSSCEIMEVNEAVQKTIISINHLEQILYEKLQTAQELCKCEKKVCI